MKKVYTRATFVVGLCCAAKVAPYMLKNCTVTRHMQILLCIMLSGIKNIRTLRLLQSPSIKYFVCRNFSCRLYSILVIFDEYTKVLTKKPSRFTGACMLLSRSLLVAFSINIVCVGATTPYIELLCFTCFVIVLSR